MTTDEVAPFVGQSVRVTLADGRMFAGTLRREEGVGVDDGYVVVSPALRAGERSVNGVIESASLITQIDDASGDEAAVG